jgi:hypothetical protein
MKFHKNVLITGFLLSLMLTPNIALGFIANENEAEALEFVKQIGFDYSFSKEETVTFGELVRVLIDSNTSFNSSEVIEYKINDVPAEFEAYAEKARKLGLVYYSRENPVFGYNEQVSIGKALDTAFKYYGLATPRYLLDEAKFKLEVHNFNSKFIDSPLIERGLLLGILEAKEHKVSYFEKITKKELASAQSPS